MSRQQFSMDDYIDVAERIVEFREKHPDGCLQPADPLKPFEVVEVSGQPFIVVVAAAYRSADDPKPGVGMAWEPFPGPTAYTKNSELQNAETSAWGRAIVAALAADTKRGIASRQEVQTRQQTPTGGGGEAPPSSPPPADKPPTKAHQAALDQLDALIAEAEAEGLEGNYDRTREYAAESTQKAKKAVASLQGRLSEHRAKAGPAPFETAPAELAADLKEALKVRAEAFAADGEEWEPEDWLDGWAESFSRLGGVEAMHRRDVEMALGKLRKWEGKK